LGAETRARTGSGSPAAASYSRTCRKTKAVEHGTSVACSSIGRGLVAPEGFTLEIRVVSSLTPDDEARYATTFAKVIAAVLENATITYAIQIQLRDGAVVHHTHGLSPLKLEAPA